MLLNKMQSDDAMPFGPFIAGAGWIALLYGDALLESYARISGLR
jgi:leader peptidase (prepilin peptidase) / N-methyltransferase